jgi:hypothetical protein
MKWVRPFHPFFEPKLHPLRRIDVMKKTLGLLALCLTLSVSAFSQKNDPVRPAENVKAPLPQAAKAVRAPADIAKATLAAHGGEKLSGIKSLVLRGSVDITASAAPQAIPATFSMVFSGERYRLDLNNPIQPISQVFDGTNTQTTVQNGFELPPINRVGFIMLSKVGDKDFPITALPESSKKKAGFRITSPEGFYTDYLIDEKTGQLKGYESSYEVNGRVVTTSVAIDKCRLVEGVLVPERFSQRFDLGQFTAYADFKAKEILVNTAIANDVFTLSK